MRIPIALIKAHYGGGHSVMPHIKTANPALVRQQRYNFLRT